MVGRTLGLPAIVRRASALGRGAHSSRGALLKPGPPCLSPLGRASKAASRRAASQTLEPPVKMQGIH